SCFSSWTRLHSPHRLDGVFELGDIVSETFNGRTKVYLCGFCGRKMLHCGVLMDLLFGENGKTKHLWPPWVLEFFMGLLQFVPVELECGFSQWRFGDVACEFVCCTNVSCASRKMFCSILVLVSLPQPYGKHVSLSTVSKKAVLDYFHKHVFCGFSFATPFTSRCHTMGLFCCTTLLVLERECELATDWDFPWGFMVSYSTGTTACNWSTSHAISRESKLFVLPMDPLSGDFMSEYGVVLRPKSGHKHKIKTNARQYKVIFASRNLGCEVIKFSLFASTTTPFRFEVESFEPGGT
ncbi:unnamed protein product, partial [Brassica oleracea var. botrytis]